MPEELYGSNRESALIWLLGKTAETRLIDFFMDNRELDFSRREILEALGMHKVTLGNGLQKLLEAGIIKPSRVIGRATLYRIDETHPVTRSLTSIIRELSVLEAEKQGSNSEELVMSPEKNGVKVPV